MHPAPIPGLGHCPPPPRPPWIRNCPMYNQQSEDTPSEYDKSFTGPRPSLRFTTKVSAKVKRHQFALPFVTYLVSNVSGAITRNCIRMGASMSIWEMIYNNIIGKLTYLIVISNNIMHLLLPSCTCVQKWW